MSATLLRTSGPLALTLAILPCFAIAQDAGTVDTIPVQVGERPQELAAELDVVEVTGSRIKRSDIEGPSPVAIITRSDIDKLGYTTVKDILGNMSYNAGGTFDAGQSFSFARGTQSIDLRGFGAGRTLVLLDGRRLPVFPQGLNGTNAFIDLSTIPSSLVERIEVLLDGASAIYGSDAIGGVVNIITRKNLEGTTATMRVSATGDGGGETQRYQFLQGFSAGAMSLQLVAEYADQAVLRFRDRDYSSSDFNNGGNGSSFGSNFFADDGSIVPDPNCERTLGFGGVDVPGDRCRFDRSLFREWIPDNQKGSLYLRGDRKIGDYDAFFRLGYYRGRQVVHLEPNPFSGGESSAFTQNRIYPDSAFPECGDDPTTLLVNEGGPCPGYVEDGAPNDPTGPDGNGGFFFRRMVEFGPRGQDLTTEALNGLVGLSGWYGDYSWQAGVAQNVVRIRGLSPTILSSVIDNEVSNNGLDLFERIPRDVVRRASHTQVETGVSRNRSLDATLTGPARFSLRGGDVRFAAHLDVVDEKYTDVFDAVSTNGDVFDGGSGGGGERALVALGGELSLPVFSMLEVAVAARYDQYYDDSDTGGALSPSAKIGYRPFDTVLLRASAGKSFRAPDLQRLFGATTAGFETVFDTPRCLDAGGQKGEPVNPSDPDDPCLEIQSVPVTVGPNPDLKEEEGTNFNVGVSWEVLQDLNLTADYYEIKVDDLVNSLTAQQILDLCGEQGQFCDQIERDPDGTLGTPSAGGSNDALIRSTAFNIAKQEIHGYDVRLSYLFGLINNWGQVRAELNWSHLTSVKVTAQPGAQAIQQLKSNDTVVMPQDRYNLTADWGLDQLGATLRIDRVGPYPGGLAGSPAEGHEFVEAFTTVGIQGRYDFGGPGIVRLGIDNLLDEEFSTDPTFQPGTPNVQNQYLGEGTSFYSNPLGRQFYAQYEISF